MNEELQTQDPKLGTSQYDASLFFKSWRRLYIFVLSELALLIFLFYVFMKFFS